MNEIIEFLRKNDLIKRRNPNIEKIESLSLSKFIDLNRELEAFISSQHKPVKNPFFSFAADPNLGGSDIECRAISCRLKRIDNLARYALLYSEEVYIESYFDKFTYAGRNSNYDEMKKDFYNDLLVLNHIRPLLESGIIKIYSPTKRICFSCQAKEILGEKTGKLFDKASTELLMEIKHNTSVVLESFNKKYAFKIIGADKYFDHGAVYIDDNLPPIIKNRKSILTKFRKEKRVVLSSKIIEELGFFEDLAHTFTHNTIYGLSTSYCLQTSFLTRSERQIEFINSLNRNPEIINNNLISEKYLSSIVPFVEDVSIKNLFKLREREMEAFINYRKALKKSLIHFKNVKGRFTQKEAREFYSDVLEPKIAQLEIKVKKAKRDLVNKPIRSVIGIAGVISFGMLSGLVPENLSQLAQVIGLTKFGSDLIKDTLKIGDKERSILEDKYYFLWKVKKMASR